MMAVSSLCFSSPSPLTFSAGSFPSSCRISRISPLAVQNRCATNHVQSLDAKSNFCCLWSPGSLMKSGADRKHGCRLNAEKGDSLSRGNAGIDEAERLARGESTMPERFRYLSKEAPDPPVRWPWFVALAFLTYTWRAVLFELSNWKKAALAVVGFVGYLLKLGFALIYQFIGNPITSFIQFLETSFYNIRAFYSGIVAYTPIPELTTVILLASAVVAIGEAVVPDSVTSQPYILTMAGVISYAAVRSYISEPFFWTLLVGLCAFSRLSKKRDNVTSTLPAAAALAAIGEPWVRVLAMVSFTALAILQHSKNVSDGSQEADTVISKRSVPPPLLAAALAIGIRMAAKWAGYRHLTWMIV